jgi:molybdate transport system substrate-binding protein
MRSNGGQAGLAGAEPAINREPTVHALPPVVTGPITRARGASAASTVLGSFLALSFAILACHPDDSKHDASIRVAVASNFVPTLRRLAIAFEQQSGESVEIASGSTGTLYAQIRAGAPFDVFLAADEARPTRLVETGLARPSSRYRYATGLLIAVVHTDAGTRGEAANPEFGVTGHSEPLDVTAPPPCLTRLFVASESLGRRIAIPNPEAAPYGRAAREVLEQLGLWTRLSPQLVRGENVAQTYHFIVSGNAAAGFVAASQLHSSPPDSLSSCRWAVPPSMHGPLHQEMVVLERAADRVAVQSFEAFMRSPEARRIIRESGYQS